MIRSVFLETSAKYGMDDLLRRSGCVIVGFSGGADSSCLLQLMLEKCRKLNVKLAAAHINHQIRGDDADSDESFCRNVCDKLEIPLYAARFDVPALAAAWGIGLEEAARKVRYDYFDEVSRILTGSAGAVIATAHNADDNLETVLFHLVRGSGTKGLCGISPVRDGRFIRPLIEISSDDIRRWCASNGIPYVTDATNNDTSYTRNLIRHRILPELRQIVPSPEDSITRMTALLRQDEDYLEQTAVSLTGTGTSLERAPLKSLHPAILSRVLRILYSRISPDSSMGEIHIRNCMELICGDRTEASLDLPANITFLMDRSSIRFTAAPDIPSHPDFEIVCDGTDFENSLYCLAIQPPSSPKNQINSTCLLNIEENIYKLSIHKTLDFDKIRGALKIRNRRPGDTVLFGGMTRRVKKLLTDQKLTAEEKSCLPILCDDDGIIWIPGFPVRDGMEFTGTGTPLAVTFHKKHL